MQGAQGDIADLLGPGARYRAVRLLGRGGMGEVYEAVHVALGSRVVVKIIRADKASVQLVERMRLEAQALARLTHTNLVRVTDFDVSASGQPFFVMELLEGNSLGTELRARGRLGVGQAIDIATQALEGLAVAHDAGVVHRDIKPDNIFLCPSAQAGRFHVKVLDFGIAKLVAGAAADTFTPIAAPTAPGRLLGTPRYIAPEQALVRPLDGRVDIYAMGLLLYEMLTGRHPFDGIETTVDLVRAHLNRVPEPPSRHLPGLSPAVDAVVLRCLEKRPEDRFATTRDLLAALYGAWRDAHAAAMTQEHPLLGGTIVQDPPEAHAPTVAHQATVPHPATVPVPPQATGVAPTAPPVPVAPPRTEPHRLPLAVVVLVLAVTGILSSLATHFLYR